MKMVCVRQFDFEPDPSAKTRYKAAHCQPGDPVPSLPRDVLRHLCRIDAIRPEGSPEDVLVGESQQRQNPVAPPAEAA